MAMDEVNTGGGVLGRPVQILSRDDAGKPQEAVRLARQLVTSDKVDLLAGGYLSNVGLALSSYALHANKLYVAGEPLTDALVWSDGNRILFPPASLHLHARCHAGAGRRGVTGKDLGDGCAKL